jgi:predicted ATPase
MGFNPEGGTKNFRFGTRASHSPLHEYLRIAKGFKRPRDGFFLRAESFFNVATEIEQLDDNPASARLSFLHTAASRCTSNRTASRFSRC